MVDHPQHGTGDCEIRVQLETLEQLPGRLFILAQRREPDAQMGMENDRQGIAFQAMSELRVAFLDAIHEPEPHAIPDARRTVARI